ncbi:10012_t:CDS:2 [Racocetra fulgida]|uniref:10012_t:CDS:1 n=1 Tax=Racocetra fulgida TaxID=60492 RepID=A0A9N9HRT9_9GLOM|nr:10012_t:CDS:2 [Racocetra fulgida]
MGSPVEYTPQEQYPPMEQIYNEVHYPSHPSSVVMDDYDFKEYVEEQPKLVEGHIPTQNQGNVYCENCKQRLVDCDPDGYASDFCSDECRREALAVGLSNPPCIQCKEFPRVKSSEFCDIGKQFKDAWKHPHKPVPEISKVWKIYCTEALASRYRLYREEVEKNQQLAGKPFPRGDAKRLMSAGNEQRRFHGTKM